MPSSQTPARALNPVRCWLRHIRRTATGETGTTVAGGIFIREPREALTGAQGWQSGQFAAALSDTGELTIVLPNAVGEDGKPHLRRFACLTDGAYRPGEEWLELYRDPHDVMATVTPYKWRVTRTTIELACYDVAGLLNRFRGSELDVWDGHSPRDVFEHYTRLPGLIVGTDFAGFVGLGTPYGSPAWITTGIAPGPHGGPRLNVPTAAGVTGISVAAASLPGAGTPTDCFTAEARGIIVRAFDVSTGYIAIGQAGIRATLFLNGNVRVDGAAGGATRVSGPPGPDAYGKFHASPTGEFSLRIVVRYDRCWLLYNGAVVVEWRRNTIIPTEFNGASSGGATVDILAAAAVVDVYSYELEALRPFALRGTDKGSYRLPGIPPAGGLRARYYNAAPAQAQYTTDPARLSHATDLTSEPAIDRLESVLDLIKGDTVPGIAGAYLARWTGAIYLDLAASDRELRLGEGMGFTRIFVGRTIHNRDELVNRWPAAYNFTAGSQNNLLRASSASFETDTVGWAATQPFWLNAGATLTRITSDANVIRGTASGKVVTTAGALQGITTTADPVWIATYLAGTTYRAVVYLRGNVGGEQVTVGLGGSGDFAISGTITLPGPTQDPIAVEVLWTPTANRSATDGTFVLAIRTVAAVAQTFYVSRARVTAGATQANTGALRATLGQEAGWYPLVVEAYRPDNLAGWLLEDRDTADASATAWRIVPASRLSPIGCFEDQLRNESHRGVLDTLTETFGYQWRTDPRTLESGEFPGQLIPRVRVGRDTDKVITDAGGVDVVVDAAADDTIDSLIADAAGIADPTGSGQLSAQVTDYTNALAHLGRHSDYESLAEMSEAAGVETRLGSLLALRSSPSEQVSVRPVDGSTDLTDTWPLTGALARMRWLPGDGLRFALADVNVIDRTARQLTRIELAVAPNAIAPPVVGFRQRPRDPSAVLKRTLRAVYGQVRNYQGTMTLIPGTAGSATGNGAAPVATGGGAVDTYSRIPLPANLDSIDRVWLHVHTFTGGTAIIEINTASTGLIVSALGIYDVTPFVRAFTAQARCFARLINHTTGNTAEYMLLGRYRI